MENQSIPIYEFRRHMKDHLDRANNGTIYVRRGKLLYRIGLVPDRQRNKISPKTCTHGKENGMCLITWCPYSPNYQPEYVGSDEV